MINVLLKWCVFINMGRLCFFFILFHHLGESKIHDLLGRTLDEEEETDANLSEIAKDVNDEACEIADFREQE